MNMFKMPQGNPLQQMLMSKLQQVNPAGYNEITKAMKTGANPEAMVRNIIKEQNVDVSQLRKQAEQLGVPPDILNKLG